MKMNDLFKFVDKSFRQNESNFENRLLYAELANSHNCNVDSKFGYLDGAKECLETYKPIEELEEYINEYEYSQNVIDEYDKAYILAFRDYIKQKKKESVTNE